jgi:hypothetical protein
MSELLRTYAGSLIFNCLIFVQFYLGTTCVIIALFEYRLQHVLANCPDCEKMVCPPLESCVIINNVPTCAKRKFKNILCDLSKDIYKETTT